MRVIVNPESGWFGSLPSATQDFVMRKITRAQVNQRHPVELHVTGTGALRHTLPGSVADPKRLDRWPVLGAKLADTMRLAPPWLGASDGR